MTNVPFINLKAQYEAVSEEIKKGVMDVLENQYYVLGPYVEKLEKVSGHICGSKYAIAVTSGTDALLLSMMAGGIQAGDEVITTTYSFFATASTIYRLGAKPVFVDIDPKTYNIDPTKIEASVTEKTKAIIPVHLYGQCAEMDPILEIAKRHNLLVIEDAAQAYGASYRGKAAGSMGDFGCFSFYPTKNLGGIGEGGLITVQDEEKYDKLRAMRNHGDLRGSEYHTVGGNFRMGALQAAGLVAKLDHVEKWNNARYKNAVEYRGLVKKNQLEEKVKLPFEMENGKHIYHQFVVQVDERDKLREFLNEKGVGSAIYYPIPLPKQPCFAHLGYKEEDYAVSLSLSEHGLALPIFPELTTEQKSYVVDCLKEFYN